MPTYAILANPGHNRVYFNESLKLSVKELEHASPFIGAGISNIRSEEICGIWYIVFDSERELETKDLARLGEMSFTYAAFLVDGRGFRPVGMIMPDFMGGEINTILKYSGKTNELFTRLMVNMALYSSKFAGGNERIYLFDPVCGKGTTLFEGLMRGWNVMGIESLASPAHEAEVFLTRYLKEKRYIHRVFSEKRSDRNGKKIADCAKISLAQTREMFSDDPRNFTIFAGDTRKATDLWKKSSLHLLVADLPYGVQHGSQKSQAKLTRDPTELLAEALPGWISLMRSGGAMAVAYNVNVTPRRKLVGIFEACGLTVPDIDMTHRVDQSILRDIVIAQVL